MLASYYMVQRSRLEVTVLVLLVAGLAYWLGHRRGQENPALDSPAVLRETQRLRQLVTLRYTIQKVVGLKESRPALGEESLLLIVQGRVLGGVDLAHLSNDEIHVVAPRKLQIKLPPAQILEAFLDEKETRVWDRRLSWWTPWSADPSMEQRARLSGLDAIRQAALDMGLLGEARRQAETAIRDLFTAQGVEVAFEPNAS